MYRLILKINAGGLGGTLAGREVARSVGLYQGSPFVLDMEDTLECVAGNKDAAKASLLLYYRMSLSQDSEGLTRTQINEVVQNVADSMIDEPVCDEDVDYFARASYAPRYYTVLPSDVEEAYQRRCRPGEEVDQSVLLDWVEKDLTERKLILHPDWRQEMEQYMAEA